MNKQKLEELINAYSGEKFADLLFQANFEESKKNLDATLPSDDVFAAAQQLGEIKTRDNQKVIVVETKVNNDLSERSSRKKQFDIGKKLLQNNHAYSAGLFVFYDDRGAFRLSLVYPKFEGTKRSYNSFKRYTFFVDPSHSNKTFINQFAGASFDTLDSIKEAFSVAKVTYDFFKEYKRLFEQIVEHIEVDTHFPNFAEQNGITINDVAKKLLGQIVFLYFLQRKGWLGAPKGQHVSKGDQNFLRTLFNKAKESEAAHPDTQMNFFNDYLEYLFYDALNKPISDSATSCYRQRFDCQIPFLNGGLFEPIPEYKWQERFLQIPDDIFSNKKETGVLDIFDSYNFTIDENSADDQEVSVDPEMLGKVFENLLEENLRKGSGSFYTPREIVQYMVTESLKQYLQDKTDISKEKIESVLEEYHNECEVSKSEAEKIDTALKEIKVVDPACGSGAFLVGLLQEIAHIRHYCQRCYQTEPQTYYQIKKEIIRDSIYGVDLDAGAVDIARLRFWLSMVVDHDIEIDDIEPLPNLDYKLMQGNSLLEHMYVGDIKIKLDFESDKRIKRSTKQGKMFDDGEEELETQTLGFSEDTGDRLADKLVRHHNEFFAEKDPTKKVQLKKKIDSLESELIVAGHDDALNVLNSQLKNCHKKPEGVNLVERIQEVKESKEKWLKFKTRPYFPWKLHFSEVFESGGFDIVIANPPYIKERDAKDVFEQVNKSDFGKKYHQGKMDFWYYFLHLAIDIVKHGGTISFITSRYWLNSKGASKLITRVKNEVRFTNVIDIGKLKVFDDVAGHHMVALYKNESGASDFIYKILHDDLSGIESKVDGKNVEVKTISNTSVFTDDNEINFNGYDINLYDCSPLGTIADISQGVVQNPDKVSKKAADEFGLIQGEGVFVLNNNELRELNLNKDEMEFIKPFYDEKNSKKFHFNSADKKHIIYITKHNCKSIDIYPNIKSHLNKYRKIMEKRRETIKGTVEWYQLHWPRDPKYFESPKIVFPSMFSDSTASFVNHPAYFGMGTSIIIQNNEDFSLLYILGLINSSFGFHWFNSNGKMRGAGLDIGVDKLRSFPVKNAASDAQGKISSIVEKIIKLKSEDMDSSNQERELDEAVINLYNLSENERRKLKNV